MEVVHPLKFNFLGYGIHYVLWMGLKLHMKLPYGKGESPAPASWLSGYHPASLGDASSQ